MGRGDWAGRREWIQGLKDIKVWLPNGRSRLSWPARVIPSTEGMKLCVFLTLCLSEYWRKVQVLTLDREECVELAGASESKDWRISKCDYSTGGVCLSLPRRVNPSAEGKLKCVILDTASASGEVEYKCWLCMGRGVVNWPAWVDPSTEGMKLCVFLTLCLSEYWRRVQVLTLHREGSVR
jgi:hypothetical protein